MHSLRRGTNVAVTMLVMLFGAEWSRAQLPSPEQFFGFRMGTERQLVDYDQLVAYFRVLAEGSPRIRLHTIGATTEGNPFVVAAISSATNLRREAYYRTLQAKLADARRTPPEEASRLIAEGRGIVSINCSIHPSEIGASQMAPELAFELVTDESPAAELVRNEVILLLIPAHNPDGLNMVAHWYREQLGTPYEGTLPPRLYHRYTGHDLNRDWFMLTQAETGLTVDSVYNVWHPHVVLDMHQMGSNGARLFLPPYVDPIDPNVDPVQQAAMTMLGTHVAAELTAQGFAGVIMHSDFDAYTPARSYPNYHGGIRFLSEVASCRVASPITVRRDELTGRAGQGLLTRRWNHLVPWTGGTWTLRDVVDYDKAVAWSVLQHVARNRELWLRNAYVGAQRPLRPDEDLAAFVVPRQQHDRTAAVQMLRILRRGLVEAFEATRPFRAAGRLYEAGTFVIPLAQPYGAYARTLLEARKYEAPRVHPQAPPAQPYDVTAHQLPLLMGVRVEAVSEPLPPDLELRPAPLVLEGGVQGQSSAKVYALSPTDDRVCTVLNFALEHGARGQWAQERFAAGGRTWPAGTFVLTGDVPCGALDSVAAATGVAVVAMNEVPRVATRALRRPRVGVYQSYAATADEGWLRWVLERDGFRYWVLHDSDVRAGRLAEQFDAVILPSMSERALLEGLRGERYPAAYSGGLGEAGTKQLRDFVEQGGTLLALGSSCALPLRYFALPVRNVLAGEAGNAFRCPGSLLRAQCDPSHPLSFGLPAEVALFVSEEMAFACRACSAPITFAADSLLLSGWLEGERLIAGQAALVACQLGKGKVVLFGFRPHFRAWTVGTFKALFNALYWSAAE